MEKTIKLAAIIPMIALGTTACAPNSMYHANNAIAPSANTKVYSYPTRAVSGKTPVTHSHSGKVHSHALPAQGIMHSHTTGQTKPRQASYRPPVKNVKPPQRTARPLIQYQPPKRPAPQRPAYQPPRQQPVQQATRPTTRPVQQATRPTTYQAPVTKPVTSTSLPSNNYSYYSYSPATTATSAQAASKPKADTSYYYDTPKPKTSNNSASTSYYNYYDYSAPATSTAPDPKPNTTASVTTNSTSYYDTSTPSTPSTNNNVSSNTDAYVVKRGDTVFQVMRNTGVYWKDIIRLNNLQAPNYTISPGQRLALK